MTCGSFSYGESAGSVVVDGVGLAEVSDDLGSAVEDVDVVMDDVLELAVEVDDVDDAELVVDAPQPVNARTPTPPASAAAFRPCFILLSPSASVSRIEPYVDDRYKDGIACEKH